MTVKTMRAAVRLALLAGCVASVLAAAPAAEAAQGIESFEVTTTTTQAGGHPDLEMKFALSNPGQPEAARDISINLPSGLFGNPNAVVKCSSDDFALQQCPLEAQVGTVTIRANYEEVTNRLLGSAPVYVMEPQNLGETARLAFIVPVVAIPVNVPIAVRTADDYGLRMTVTGISQTIPLQEADVTIWGVPAATVHDDLRFESGSLGSPAGCPREPTAYCASLFRSFPHKSPLAPAPLIDNPTICTGEPLVVSLDVTTYQDEGGRSHAETSYPPTSGCYNETFAPVLEASLTSGRADSPAGLDVKMQASQFLGLANAPSSLKSASISLPEGVSINPDAADGQTACADTQVHFESEGAAECPDNSKIGTFDIQTPALDGPLTGSLYFGEPKPGDQYRVFMVASGFGINAKFVASVRPDPRTGQLDISVSGLPQVPFAHFNLHLFASDRGLIATPTYCRLYEVDSLFVPWNDRLPSQQSNTYLSVDSGPGGGPCPGPVRPFHPRLVAGATNPLAGDFSSFLVKLDRDDGDQFLRDLNFRMPPGFTGNLRGIAYCSEDAIAAAARNSGRSEQQAASCPAASQIGTTNVAAGPGSHPFHAVGKMYLAGPFKGAPLSLAAITPALAGPFDYGVVVVRVALHIDPRTAQVSAVSDTMPSIIGGVPIRMRSIQVNIDKTEFTINPTNCSPFSVDSQGIGDQGTVTEFSSYFHVVDCSRLPFRPRMGIRLLGGRKGARRTKNPRLQFDLFTRHGDANLRSVAVTLSKAFQIDQGHLFNICSKSQLQAELCKGRQQMGRVWVKTPLLDRPLTGPAYAVSGYGRLPHLFFILDGQVTMLPQATSSSDKSGRIRTVVPVVPDVPIGHFRLTLLGGRKGYLQNTKNLCRRAGVIIVAYRSQHGEVRRQRIKPRIRCRK